MRTSKRMTGWFFALAAVFLLATALPASAGTIALWNYNDQTEGITAANPYTTGVGDQNPSANVGTGSQAWYSTGAGTPIFSAWGYNSGLQPSNGNGDFTIDDATGLADMRYRAEGVSAGEGLQWTVSTAGYTNIKVQLSVFTTSNLSSAFSFDYYNGTNWVEATTAAYVTSTKTTYDISPGADANNNANFQFRFLRDTGTTGATITYDWVLVEGTPQAVPIPAAAWLLGSGLLGLVAIRRRMKK